MEPKERIYTLRLLEKLLRQPQWMIKLGLEGKLCKLPQTDKTGEIHEKYKNLS